MARVETGTQSRQGEKGRPVLYILIAAVILAVIAGAGALTWQGAVSPPDPATKSQDAARSTATDPTTPPANPTPTERKPN